VEVTRDKPGYRGFIGAEQLDWLASDLARIPSTQPVIAATHMPLRTAAFGQTEAGGGPADQVVVNARQVLDVLMHRQLVLVLQGHSHRSDAIQEAGVTFLSGGAISGPGWNDDHGGATPGFVVASVRPERVDWQYVGYSEP
jgi:3',5'-cyclic AMP phosphodiesterase CpdA